MEAVREIDLVDPAVSPRPSVCKAVGDGSDGKNPAALGDEPFGTERRPRVKYRDTLDLFGRFELSDQPAARRRSRIAPRGHDYRDRS